MQFGAYSGLSSFVFFLFIYFFTSNPLGNWSWLGGWIPVLFIVMGIKQYRDEHLEGYIRYWQGVGAGAFISTFACLIFAFTVFLFGTVGDPMILDNQKAEALQGIEKAKEYWTNESLINAMAEAESKISEMTMAEVSQSTFMNGLLWGLMVSLVVAGMMRKNKPFFEETSGDTEV